MYAIVLLVVVATLSLVITRVASVMLTGTGMAREAARFQARSALSGVGFTTGSSAHLPDPAVPVSVQPGDTALIYGHDEALGTLSRRTRGTEGDQEHAGGVAASQARNERDERPGSAGRA